MDIFLVFDLENSIRATFSVPGGLICPVAIKNNLFILQVELEPEIINQGGIDYIVRGVLESEFITEEII